QEAVCAAVGLAGLPEDESLRTRLEHAGNFVTDEATVAAWREAQIVPLAQPVFLYNFFGDFLPIYLGDHARHGRYPLRTLLGEGWRVASSSALHVGAEDRATNPLFSMWCCLARQSYLGSTIEAEERITFEDALRMHTIHAAAALGEERNRGSLEP